MIIFLLYINQMPEIGRGTYGLVLYPGIICKEAMGNENDYISKIFLQRFEL
jgi:hypothetical protein